MSNWWVVLLALPGTIVSAVELYKLSGKLLRKCEVLLYEWLKKHLHK